MLSSKGPIVKVINWASHSSTSHLKVKWLVKHWILSYNAEWSWLSLHLYVLVFLSSIWSKKQTIPRMLHLIDLPICSWVQKITPASYNGFVVRRKPLKVAMEHCFRFLINETRSSSGMKTRSRRANVSSTRQKRQRDKRLVSLLDLIHIPIMETALQIIPIRVWVPTQTQSGVGHVHTHSILTELKGGLSSTFINGFGFSISWFYTTVFGISAVCFSFTSRR